MADKMGMLKKAVTSAAKKSVKPGYHKMPDGSMMRDSDMGKGVPTSKQPTAPKIGMPPSMTMDVLPTTIPIPKNISIPQRTTLEPTSMPVPSIGPETRPKVRSINPNPIRVPSGGDFQVDGSLKRGAIPRMRRPLMERDPMSSGVGPIPLGTGSATSKIPVVEPRRSPRRPQPYDRGTGNQFNQPPRLI